MAVDLTHYAPASQSNTGASANITGVAWAENEFILVFGGTSNSTVTMGLPTHGSLTFAVLGSIEGGSSEANSYCWWAQAPSGSNLSGQTIVLNRSSGSGTYHGHVEVTTGAGSLTAITSNRNEAGFSIAVGTGDAVAVCCTDWNATAVGKTPSTGSGTATERYEYRDGGGAYTAWAAVWKPTVAGTYTFSPNNYTGWKVAKSAALAVAAGGLTLVVADVTCAAVVDNVDVTQHQVLVVADVTVACVLDTADLTQHQAIAVDDVTIATTVDGVTVNTPLIVADMTIACVLDTLALTQHQTLTTDDVTVSCTVDDVALTQHHVLEVADTSTGVTVDNVAVSTAGSLGVNDTATSVTIDDVDLTQHHVFSVDDVAVASAIGAVVLAVSIALIVADLTTASTVDSATLTQHQGLTVDDVTVASTLESVTLTQAQSLTVADITVAVAVDNLVFIVPTTPGRMTLTIDAPEITIGYDAPTIAIGYAAASITIAYSED